MNISRVNKWLKFDQYCVLCDEPCGTEQALCLACEAELPWLDHACECCALPLTAEEQGPLCARCQLQSPSFTRVESPWRFAFPLDSLISRFKHSADWPVGRVLTGYLARHLEHAYAEGLPRPEALLPVPISRRRLRQRGFDQTLMLAEWLGKQIGIPVAGQLIQRVRDTTSQQQLNAQERHHNLQQAFALNSAQPLRHRHIAVVDDVLTTGSTAETLAQLLRKAGVERVDVYCLARTPRPGHASS